MMRLATMRKGTWIAGALLAGAVAFGSWSFMPNTVHAFCQQTTVAQPAGSTRCVDEGVPLSWQRRCLSYAIDDRGSAASAGLTLDDITAAVETSFETWADTTCGGQRTDLVVRRFADSTCREAQYNATGGNVNTVAFVALGGNAFNAFAVTNVVFDTGNGRILDADMLLNEDMAPFAICPAAGCPAGPTPNTGPVDLQSIVTHEAGHFYGLAHSSVADATMSPSMPRTETDNRTLAQDDVDGLCSIYPPGSCDQSCTPFPEPVNGLDLNCEDGIAPAADVGNADVCFGGGSSGGCALGVTDTNTLGGNALLALGLGLLAVLRRRRR